jgi:hypothetical protein
LRIFSFLLEEWRSERVKEWMIVQNKNESLHFISQKCHYLRPSRKVDCEELSIHDQRFDGQKQMIENERMSANILRDSKQKSNLP